MFFICWARGIFPRMHLLFVPCDYTNVSAFFASFSGPMLFMRLNLFFFSFIAYAKYRGPLGNVRKGVLV